MAAVDDRRPNLSSGFSKRWVEFVKGNPEPAKELFSRKDDVTLANPLGPPARGVG